jgi:hypothetical protein
MSDRPIAHRSNFGEIFLQMAGPKASQLPQEQKDYFCVQPTHPRLKDYFLILFFISFHEKSSSPI